MRALLSSFMTSNDSATVLAPVVLPARRGGLGWGLLGVLAFSGLMLATGRFAWPSLAQAAEVPWWAWLGGLLGTVAVLAQLTVSRQIGAAPFLAIVVTAGVATSIGLDHFGLVGFERHPASLWRIFGAVLMVAGVTLVCVS